MAGMRTRLERRFLKDKWHCSKLGTLSVSSTVVTSPVGEEEKMSQQATSERIMGIGLLASLIASLIAGIGARIIMRIVALTAHMPPGFSIAGSLNIVFLVLILGTMPSFVYALCLFFLSSST